jgi:hypothetical protein
VVSFVPGASHAFAQTYSQADTGKFGISPPRTWGWGSNEVGQLGPSAILDSAVFSPTLLPRSSFPKFGNAWENGNQVTSSQLAYDVWNRTSLSIQTFSLRIEGGPMTIASIQSTIASGMARNGHASDVFQFFTNSVTEGVEILVQRSGYQLDLNSSRSLRDMLGFDETVNRIPKYGFLNEISDRLGNNVLAYDFWNGSIIISAALKNNKFRFSAWSKAQSRAIQYSRDVSDGSYTPFRLADALNSIINAAAGIPNAISLGGSNMGADDRVQLTSYYPGLIFTMSGGQSFFSGNNSLGFQEGVGFPDPSTYGGSSLPNEVSSAAQTNLFHYRSNGTLYNLTLSPGIQNLTEIENLIYEGMMSNEPFLEARVFKFSTDTESRVVLEIASNSYVAVFSMSNTIGKYLGFLDIDLPCNIFQNVTVENVSEEDVISGRYVPNGSYCISAYASSQSDVFRKRGAYNRPLVSAFTAQGNCSAAGFDRRCVCAESIPSCISLLDKYVSTGTGGGCSCRYRNFSWDLRAVSIWGAVHNFVSIFRNGLYDTFLDFSDEIKQAVKKSMESILPSPYLYEPISLSANVSSSKLVLRLTIEHGGGFRINISNSTVLKRLGFNGSIFPQAFAVAGSRYSMQALEPRPTLFSGQVSESFPAQYLGEWVHKIVVGDLHTVVQTTDNTSCFTSRCCKFR